jgi:hypothetical protein
MPDAEMEDNVDQVMNWVDGLVDSFDFTLPGKDESLARDLAGLVAQGIFDRSAEARGADGTPWPPNERKYRAWKERRYHQVQPLKRTGQMLSLLSLMGETKIRAKTVEMVYGINEPPTDTETGDPLMHKDKKVTDREKAEWNSPERPFYQLDNKIRDAAIDLAGEALAEYLKSTS